jgi:hypothetical protein
MTQPTHRLTLHPYQEQGSNALEIHSHSLGVPESPFHQIYSRKAGKTPPYSAILEVGVGSLHHSSVHEISFNATILSTFCHPFCVFALP